jgi:hypothetical protein
MIAQNEYASYELYCDYCEESSGEVFDEYMEAVAYKQTHGWRSLKDKNNDWVELCPSCQQPDIIRKLKGWEA